MRALSIHFALSVLVAAASAASPASAQVEAGEISLALTGPDPGDAYTHIHSGIALLVSGLSTAGAGVGLQLGFGGMIGLAGGGTLMGVGSLLLFSGIPTWIVGAVRESIANASSVRRAEVAGRWELAGVLVFCVSMAVAALGAGLVGTSFSATSIDEAQMVAGSTLLSAGVAIAAFVGAPMWAEGARF